MAICRRYAQDAHEAADMQQEGFIKCFRLLAQYGGTGSLEGWVRRVFVTTCLDLLRQRRRQTAWAAPLDEALGLEAPADNAFLLSADAADLTDAIAALPDGARVVFNLFAVEGYSHAEISKIMAISEGSSRSQLNRARTLLKVYLLRANEPKTSPAYPYPS